MQHNVAETNMAQVTESSKRLNPTPMFSISRYTSTRTARSTPQDHTAITCIAGLVLDLESRAAIPFGKSQLACGTDPSRNINIPWPTKGMGDPEYLYAFQNVVMPVAQSFDPDLVISKIHRSESNISSLTEHQSPQVLTQQWEISSEAATSPQHAMRT